MIISGALALPRWPSIASMDSSASSSTTTLGTSQDDASVRSQHHNKSLEQTLLTTCVGSLGKSSNPSRCFIHSSAEITCCNFMRRTLTNTQ